MWARKMTRVCIEEDGVQSEQEYVEINDSWYDVLGQGGVAIVLGFVMLLAGIFFTPVMAIREAYMAYRYANIPVPQNEVRERAHL